MTKNVDHPRSQIMAKKGSGAICAPTMTVGNIIILWQRLSTSITALSCFAMSSCASLI